MQRPHQGQPQQQQGQGQSLSVRVGHGPSPSSSLSSLPNLLGNANQQQPQQQQQQATLYQGQGNCASANNSSSTNSNSNSSHSTATPAQPITMMNQNPNASFGMLSPMPPTGMAFSPATVVPQQQQQQQPIAPHGGGIGFQLPHQQQQQGIAPPIDPMSTTHTAAAVALGYPQQQQQMMMMTMGANPSAVVPPSSTAAGQQQQQQMQHIQMVLQQAEGQIQQHTHNYFQWMQQAQAAQAVGNAQQFQACAAAAQQEQLNVHNLRQRVQLFQLQNAQHFMLAGQHQQQAQPLNAAATDAAPAPQQQIALPTGVGPSVPATAAAVGHHQHQQPQQGQGQQGQPPSAVLMLQQRLEQQEQQMAMLQRQLAAATAAASGGGIGGASAIPSVAPPLNPAHVVLPSSQPQPHQPVLLNFGNALSRQQQQQQQQQGGAAPHLPSVTAAALTPIAVPTTPAVAVAVSAAATTQVINTNAKAAVAVVADAYNSLTVEQLMGTSLSSHPSSLQGVVIPQQQQQPLVSLTVGTAATTANLTTPVVAGAVASAPSPPNLSVTTIGGMSITDIQQQVPAARVVSKNKNDTHHHHHQQHNKTEHDGVAVGAVVAVPADDDVGDDFLLNPAEELEAAATFNPSLTLPPLVNGGGALLSDSLMLSSVTDISHDDADDDELLRKGDREELIREYRQLLRQCAHVSSGGMKISNAHEESAQIAAAAAGALVPKKSMRIFLPKIGELPAGGGGGDRGRSKVSEDKGHRVGGQDGVSRCLANDPIALSAGFCINSKKFFTSSVGYGPAYAMANNSENGDNTTNADHGGFVPTDVTSAAMALSPRPYTLNATSLQNISRRVNGHLASAMGRLDKRHYYALRDAGLLPSQDGKNKRDSRSSNNKQEDRPDDEKEGNAEVKGESGDRVAPNKNDGGAEDPAEARRAREKLLAKAKDHTIRNYFQIQRWAQLPHNPLNGLGGVNSDDTLNAALNAHTAAGTGAPTTATALPASAAVSSVLPTTTATGPATGASLMPNPAATTYEGLNNDVPIAATVLSSDKTQQKKLQPPITLEPPRDPTATPAQPFGQKRDHSGIPYASSSDDDDDDDDSSSSSLSSVLASPIVNSSALVRRTEGLSVADAVRLSRETQRQNGNGDARVNDDTCSAEAKKLRKKKKQEEKRKRKEDKRRKKKDKKKKKKADKTKKSKSRKDRKRRRGDTTSSDSDSDDDSDSESSSSSSSSSYSDSDSDSSDNDSESDNVAQHKRDQPPSSSSSNPNASPTSAAASVNKPSSNDDMKEKPTKKGKQSKKDKSSSKKRKKGSSSSSSKKKRRRDSSSSSSSSASSSDSSDSDDDDDNDYNTATSSSTSSGRSSSASSSDADTKPSANKSKGSGGGGFGLMNSERRRIDIRKKRPSGSGGGDGSPSHTNTIATTSNVSSFSDQPNQGNGKREQLAALDEKAHAGDNNDNNSVVVVPAVFIIGKSEAAPTPADVVSAPDNQAGAKTATSKNTTTTTTTTPKTTTSPTAEINQSKSANTYTATTTATVINTNINTADTTNNTSTVTSIDTTTVTDATREFYCDACQKGFGKNEERYKEHCEKSHLNCPIPGCGFFCKKGVLLYESETEEEETDDANVHHTESAQTQKRKVKRPHYKGEWKIQLHLDTLHYRPNGLTAEDFLPVANKSDGVGTAASTSAGAPNPVGVSSAASRYVANRKSNFPTADRVQSRVEELFYRASRGEVLTDERRRWLRSHGVVVKRPPPVAQAIIEAANEGMGDNDNDEKTSFRGNNKNDNNPYQQQRLEMIKRRGAAIAHEHCVTSNTPVIIRGQSQLVLHDTAASVVGLSSHTDASEATALAVNETVSCDTANVENRNPTTANQRVGRGCGGGAKSKLNNNINSVTLSSFNAISIPPPAAYYVCPRCGVKGDHWLASCPTKGDTAYDKHSSNKTTTTTIMTMTTTTSAAAAAAATRAAVAASSDDNDCDANKKSEEKSINFLDCKEKEGEDASSSDSSVDDEDDDDDDFSEVSSSRSGSSVSDADDKDAPPPEQSARIQRKDEDAVTDEESIASPQTKGVLSDVGSSSRRMAKHSQPDAATVGGAANAAMDVRKQTQQLLKRAREAKKCNNANEVSSAVPNDKVNDTNEGRSKDCLIAPSASAASSATSQNQHQQMSRQGSGANHHRRPEIYIPSLYDRLVAPEKVNGYGLLLQAFRYIVSEDFFGDEEYRPAPKRAPRTEQ